MNRYTFFLIFVLMLVSCEYQQKEINSREIESPSEYAIREIDLNNINPSDTIYISVPTKLICKPFKPEHGVFYEIVKWSAPLFYIVLFILICVLVIKYTRATDITKKKKYSTYTFASFTAIVLTSLEYIRILFEWLLDKISLPQAFDPFNRLLIILVSLFLAFFVERKEKFANYLLKGIKKFILALEDMVHDGNVWINYDGALVAVKDNISTLKKEEYSIVEKKQSQQEINSLKQITDNETNIEKNKKKLRK